MNELLAYYQQLRPRERNLLIAAAVLIVVMLFYLTIWEPVVNKRERLGKSVEDQIQLVQWMRQTATEIKALNGTQQRGAGAGAGGSLLGVIDRTAKGGKLGDAMKRIEPDGTNRVRVWLEQAAFDDLVAWLESVERDYGMNIQSAVIDASSSPGRVSARLVIEGA